jgi:hypothetical protein
VTFDLLHIIRKLKSRFPKVVSSHTKIREIGNSRVAQIKELGEGRQRKGKTKCRGRTDEKQRKGQVKAEKSRENREIKKPEKQEKTNTIWQFDFKRFATVLINNLVDLCVCE